MGPIRLRSLLGALSLAAALASAALVGACEDDQTGAADAGSEAGHHAAHDAAKDSPVDAAPPPIRCTDEELAANDKTDGGALEITFNAGANPRQYESRCATVKVGATVAFAGSFVQHPLEPAGGDAPNPIPYVATEPPGGKLLVTMPTPGTFGFQCEYHPLLMFGAIRVVP